MAYDERLAGRVREALKGVRGVAEKKMFGGLTFMVRGHMCCGVAGADLMLRLSPEEAAEALRRPHAREMDFTGKPLKGFVFVGPAGTAQAASLKRWVDLAVAHARSLPAK